MHPRKFSLSLLATAVLSTAVATTLVAQTVSDKLTPSTPLAATAPTAVPALVPFSGAAIGSDGKPLSGEVGVTFLIFSGETGGEPLFAETQTVAPENNGRYKVQLGSTLSSGLPIDLFATGEARWLEVQVAGQLPQPRVLLASVPYAMKSADAATLGGLPASAFMLAGSRTSADAITANATTSTAADVTTTGGTSGYVPVFNGASAVVDSPVFVNGANVGIGTTTPSQTLDVNGPTAFRGNANLFWKGSATPSAGANSESLSFSAETYDSSTASVFRPYFSLLSEAAGNNTASPSATLNLQFGNGTTLVETGLYINSNGTIHFAPNQTFPSTGTGTGTITGVTPGTGLTGGGASGNVTLSANQSVVAFQTDLTKAENTLNASIATAQAAAVSTSETYTKNNFLALGGGTVNGSMTVQGSTVESDSPGNFFTVAGGDGAFGINFPGAGVSISAGSGGSEYNSGENGGAGASVILAAGSGGYSESAFAGNGGNIILQVGAGGGAPSPVGNPGLPGNVVVAGDDNGVYRNAPHQLQIQGASNPNKQLLIGYLADAGSDSGFGAIQATYNGVANTPLSLNPNGGGVGIQTTNVTNSLTIGQGQGAAIADGWYSYSSRRFKTNIQTLSGALDKVEKMRGVSYTLKATGKREIGVIAEEVGAVVPEVVTYEANGKDARSVDYTRLTALLIEATKQQQAEIEKERSQIARQGSELTAAIRQIHRQEAWMQKQTAATRILRAEVRAANQKVRKENKQLPTELAILTAK